MISPGQTLAGRFSIVRFLGSGGMGEVFEADDLLLRDRVAVKVVSSRKPGSEGSFDRLRREVQLARKVTHRNVCRIFDLVQYQSDRGTVFDLVSMELLEGEDLSRHLKRSGPLPVDQTLAIVRQIARGMVAAHRLGIVHRDLKPGNVMLVPEGDEFRAVITDFGLAYRIGGTWPRDPNSTQSGVIIGTPAYLAPEQASGEPTTAATDIYSLGLLAYEMLAGRLPFSAGTPWQLVAQRLTDDPEPLRRLVPDLDPEIGNVVDRCLCRRPSDRIQSAAELLSLLDLGDSGWEIYGKKRSLPTEPAPKPATETPDAAGPPTPALFSSRLAGAAGLAAMVFTAAIGLWRPWHAPNVSATAEATPVAFHRGSVPSDLPSLPADTALVGASQEGFSATVDAAAVDAAAVDAAAVDAAAVDAASRMLAIYEAGRAIEILNESLRAHGDHPILQRALSESFWRAGQEPEAREAAARALAQAGTVTRQQRLHIEALHQGLHGDWRKATDTFKSLWIHAPDHLEYGLWILEAHYLTGETDSLPEMFRALRALPAPLGQDPRIDLWRAKYHLRNAEYEPAAELAQALVGEMHRRDLRFLKLEGLLVEKRARIRLGGSREYIHVVSALARVAEESGDRFYSAHALGSQARFLNRSGRMAEATDRLHRAEALYRELGSRRGLCEISEVFGHLDSARKSRVARLEEGLRLCTDGGFEDQAALVRYYLAKSYVNRGAFDRSAPLFRESAEQMEDLGNYHKVALNRLGLALQLFRMGQVDEMLHMLSEVQGWFERYPNAERSILVSIASARASLAAGRLEEAEVFWHRASELEPLGVRLMELTATHCEIQFERGDAKAYRRSVAELKNLARSLIDEKWLTVAQKLNAMIPWLEGHPEQTLEQLATYGGDPDGRLELQVRLRLEQKLEARRLLARLQPSSEQPAIWLDEILRAWAESDRDFPHSIERLQKVERETHNSGHRRLELEARLTRARLTGDSQLMLDVRNRAESSGMLRMMSEADLLLSRSGHAG